MKRSMKQGLKRVLLMGLLAVPAWTMASMPGDSVGVKVVNGKPYVLYKIAKGDNLGRISKEYGVSVANIEEINGITGANIQVGQVLMVPSRNPNAGVSLKNVVSTPSKPESAKTVSEPQNPQSSGSRKQHTVDKGETLYAVSRKYNITVDEIKHWNELTSDALKEGQKLWVGPVTTQAKTTAQADPEVKVVPKPVEKVTEKPFEVTTSAVSNNTVGTDGPKIKSSSGVHVVRPGETLFGIARTYGMDVSELRKINRLEDATIKEGQALRVKADSQENPIQGTGLADALDEVQEPTPKLEAFPDLKVLTAPSTTKVAPAAVVTMYKDKSTGKSFKRVEETGKVGRIEDYSTDQTRFYAFHRYLPVGSYIRVDYPAKGQSILVEIINQLPEKDPYAVRLSAKCLEYLMIREAGAEVRLRYVIPFAE
jgi:LysM repeat protein